MANTTLPKTDPFVIDREPTPVTMDMAEHIRTYDGFLKLAKWFTAHLAIMLVGLYCFVVAHSGGLGALFMLVGVAVLIYGIVHRPEVQHDIAAATVQPRR